MKAVFPTAEEWSAWARNEHREGRPGRAEAGFRQALTIDSSSLPARFGLASALLDRGDLDSAEAMTSQMGTMAGDSPAVRWLQARLAFSRGEPGAARHAIERLLVDPELNGEQRAEALLMLGLVLGDMGRTDEAFAAACQGKRMQKDIHAVQAGARESEVSKLRRLTSWIDTEASAWLPLPLPDVPGSAASHIFLLGFPRSGTTLLEQVLAAHPRIATLEEAPTLATAYQAFLSSPDACADLDRLSAEEAAAWAEHYWRAVRDRGVDVAGRVFVDKQPAGTLNLPVIARLFPRAKILFALRDPRDVVLSCFRQPFQINAMTYAFTDLGEAAACYDACMTLAERARAHFPLAWTDVRHEALVEDFDAEIARILAFLELRPSPAMTDFAEAARTRPIRTPSAVQVRAGLNRRGLGRWAAYRDQLAPAMPTLAPWVARFGYAP